MEDTRAHGARDTRAPTTRRRAERARKNRGGAPAADRRDSAARCASRAPASLGAHRRAPPRRARARARGPDGDPGVSRPAAGARGARAPRRSARAQSPQRKVRGVRRPHAAAPAAKSPRRLSPRASARAAEVVAMDAAARPSPAFRRWSALLRGARGLLLARRAERRRLCSRGQRRRAPERRRRGARRARRRGAAGASRGDATRSVRVGFLFLFFSEKRKSVESNRGEGRVHGFTTTGDDRSLVPRLCLPFSPKKEPSGHRASSSPLARREGERLVTFSSWRSR